MKSSEEYLRTQTFIGSSSEGLAVANAIRDLLFDVTDCQVWTEGVFLPGRTFIETLEKLLDRMDYAILVATPDDMLVKRDVESFSMRDNVLLELGLFMAKLGRERTYLVSPRDRSIHVPSDLLGLTTVDYECPTSPEEAIEALRESCEEIKLAMGEAEKELSTATKRMLVKRLLGLTNRVQAFVVALQSASVRSLADRSEFEKIRQQCADRLAGLAQDYEEDAKRLGVQEESAHLTSTVLEAIQQIPFPKEAVVSESDVVGGMFRHIVGKRSVGEQVTDRFEKLAERYDRWWDEYGARVSAALNNFQAALIAAM